ncbi:MAG: hypothetical protein H6710_11145 [Myxococcales bacterium]|nr:hypothetical protein [Myxococcales bacterium]MCB9702438.1 hypothetical protein [Myxococcales bacterium]
MSLQSKYSSVVASELRHHAVWEPGEPVRLGDYGVLQGSRFTVHGNIEDDFGLQFEVVRSRNREFAFRSDGVSESRGEGKANQPGAVAELRVGFRRADALYVSSPSAWTEQIKGLARIVSPLLGNPQWNPDWVIVTRLYHASQAIILLSNSDDADVRLNLAADGAPVGGKSVNDVGEQGSVALQLTGVRGPLFMGLHRVHRDLEDVVPRRRLVNRVLVLAGAGLLASGALASWLVVSLMHPESSGVKDPTIAQVTHPEKSDEAMGDERPTSANASAGVAAEAPLPSTTGGYGLGLGKVGQGGGTKGGDRPEPEEKGLAEGEVRVQVQCTGGAVIYGPDGERLGRCGDPGIILKDGEKTLLALVSPTRVSRAVEIEGAPGRSYYVPLDPRPRPGISNGSGIDVESPTNGKAKPTVSLPGIGACRTSEQCARGDLCLAGRCVLSTSKGPRVKIGAAAAGDETEGEDPTVGVGTTSGGEETPPVTTTGTLLADATTSGAAPAEATSEPAEVASAASTTTSGEVVAVAGSPTPRGGLRLWLWLALVGVLAGVGLLVAWALRRRGAEPVEDVAPIVEPPPGA